MTISHLTDQPIPLARSIPIDELPGWFDKYLEVPPGRTGVMFLSERASRTFPAGRWRVLSFIQRLWGQGGRLRAGYVPSEPQTALLQSPYLLSGDEVLLEAAVVIDARVADPLRFFQRIVLARGELNSALVDLSSSAAQGGLVAITRRYAADDLVSGLASEVIAQELNRFLPGVLAADGLEISGLRLVAFSRAGDRATLAEKVLDLEARLQDVELQRKLAAAETQAQLDEFTRGLQAEEPAQAGLRVMAGPAAPATDFPNFVRRLGDWFRSVKAGAPQAAPRRWNLMGLLPAQPVKTAPALPNGWWVMPGFWVVLLLAILAGGTAFIINVSQGGSADARIGFLSGLWFVMVPLLVAAIQRLVKKFEKVRFIAEEKRANPSLADWIRQDRARADQLVRRHLAGELTHSAEALLDLQNRLLKAGLEPAAIDVRQLRQKLEREGGKLGRSDCGVPLYLSEPDLPAVTWERLLNAEEDLLRFANTLGESALELQMTDSADYNPDLLRSFEQRVDLLMHRFTNRGRVV